jgi:hypothetical protein
MMWILTTIIMVSFEVLVAASEIAGWLIAYALELFFTLAEALSGALRILFLRLRLWFASLL